MKKIAYSLVLCTFFLASCGPSAEQQAAEQQRIADSVATAEQARLQDSLATVAAKATEDSLAMARMVADSLNAQHMADSIAAATKKPIKKPVKPKGPVKPEDVKAGQGKG